jgi:hypothetical protein
MKVVIALLVVLMLLVIFPIALGYIVVGFGYIAQGLVWAVTHYMVSALIILGIGLAVRK